MGNKIAVKVSIRVFILLAMVIGAGAWYISKEQSKSLEAQLLKRGTMHALIGAKAYSRVLEEAIDNGTLTVKDAFDTAYEIIPGFEPPKYHTKYDSYLDKAILAVEDEVLKDESVVFAVGVDVNGYLPTHNTRYQQPITGDKEKDLVGNRTKRMFTDPVGIKAAKNTEPGFLQVYNRDTGETMWDISAPIIVKGKHWGGFRIGFSLTKTNEAKRDLAMSLYMTLAALLIIAAIAVTVAVNMALKPLGELTRAASDLADGKVENEIAVKTTDEIGQLADVLERLRVSLKAAMDRLSRR